jgi:membrane protease YdiL (CAAX protease family)
LLQSYPFIKPQPYDGPGEIAIAVLFCILWVGAIAVRLSGVEDWSLAEILFEASSFGIFAAIPVFFLATHRGERLAHRILLPNQGLTAQIILCTALGMYVSLGHILHLNPKHFPWLVQLDHLFVLDQFWFNTLLFLGGVFVATRIPFVMLGLRQVPFHFKAQPQLCGLLLLNTLYLGLHRTGNPMEGIAVGLTYGLVCLGISWPKWKKHLRRDSCAPRVRLIPSDFFLMILCAGIIYCFSTPSFSFGVFIAVDLFILVLIYGTGLGRAHFGYSFQLHLSDGQVLLRNIAIASLVLIPVAIASGFVRPQSVANFSPLKVLSYFALFTLRVGIFEEIFFRSGLMVLFRDLLQAKTHKPSPQALVWIPALGCSVLFGLSHIGNEAIANTTLNPLQYRGLYILLATTASLFYSITFAQTNRLAPPILIHGFVDTTAVLLLGGFLVVPF